jgi:hypothetical protein
MNILSRDGATIRNKVPREKQYDDSKEIVDCVAWNDRRQQCYKYFLYQGEFRNTKYIGVFGEDRPKCGGLETSWIAKSNMGIIKIRDFVLSQDILMQENLHKMTYNYGFQTYITDVNKKLEHVLSFDEPQTESFVKYQISNKFFDNELGLFIV